MIRSCGVIPLYNDRGTLRYLLIQHKLGKHWGFPKGHVDGHETDEQTARRELREEAGITQIRLLPGYVTRDRYVVTTPLGQRPKQVTYFLGVVKSRGVVQQPEEIVDAHWFDYASARQLLANPSARRVIERVNKFLQANRSTWR